MRLQTSEKMEKASNIAISTPSGTSHHKAFCRRVCFWKIVNRENPKWQTALLLEHTTHCTVVTTRGSYSLSLVWFIYLLHMQHTGIDKWQLVTLYPQL